MSIGPSQFSPVLFVVCTSPQRCDINCTMSRERDGRVASLCDRILPPIPPLISIHTNSGTNSSLLRSRIPDTTRIALLPLSHLQLFSIQPDFIDEEMTTRWWSKSVPAQCAWYYWQPAVRCGCCTGDNRFRWRCCELSDECALGGGEGLDGPGTAIL